MKNPKVFLLLSVVVATLVLGIAYAAIQNVTLTVSGTTTVTADQANFQIKFTGNPTYAVTGHGAAKLNITGDTTAKMDVSNMTTVGDKVISNFTVINESADLIAYLSTSATHTNTEYFNVTTTLGTTELAPKDTTTTLQVIVELIKTPIENQGTTIAVEFVASPIKSEETGKIISFTIAKRNLNGEIEEEKEYFAEEGMTWNEWLGSTYDDTDIYEEGEYGAYTELLIGNPPRAYYSGQGFTGQDLICAGETYFFDYYDLTIGAP